MEYSQHQPSERAAFFISDYWSLSFSSESGVPPDPILPDGRIEMIFDLKDRFYSYFSDKARVEQPRTIVAGQLSSSILIGPSGDTDLFGVRFHPYGAYRFLRVSMHELTDTIVDTADVLGNDESFLFDMIASASSVGARAAVFEKYFFDRIGNGPSSDMPTAAITTLIENSDGSIPIDELSRSTGWSTRKLERLFLEQIGISPKLFSRVSRFRSFLKAVETDRKVPILDAVFNAGYYDQSHMTKDFRQFAGCSLMEYFRDERTIADMLANRQ